MAFTYLSYTQVKDSICSLSLNFGLVKLFKLILNESLQYLKGFIKFEGLSKNEEINWIISNSIIVFNWCLISVSYWIKS